MNSMLVVAHNPAGSVWWCHTNTPLVVRCFWTAHTQCTAHRCCCLCVAPVPTQELQQQHEAEFQRLEAALQVSQRQVAVQESARSAVEHQLQQQEGRLLQLKQALDTKSQLLRQQADAHAEELQVGHH